jgi:predicted dehydrogenase
MTAEKPLTLILAKGEVDREVVKKTGRVLQVGTSWRSATNFAD